MATKTSVSKIALPSLDEALAWIRANDPKAAATYCEADGTVQAWRKRHARRADGTIVGFYDGARGSWEPYAADAREYAARNMAAVKQKAEVSAAMRREESARLAAVRCSIRQAVAELRRFRTEIRDAMQRVPEACREIAIRAADSRDAELRRNVIFFWNQR